MSDLIVALELAFAVAMTGVLARFVSIPLPFLQIVTGVAIGLAGQRISIQPDLFFLLFVAPLLFDDAWRFSKRALFDSRRVVLSLALGLVLLTVLGVGWFVHWMIPAVPLAVAFALAAVLAPTDAIAIEAIAGGASIPVRLRHILEGEALVNDATGLVCFRFAVAAVMTGYFSLIDTLLAFLWLVIGGVIIGTVIVWAFRLIQRRIIRWRGEHPPTQVLLVLLLPFAAYLAAEELYVSGILAAVTAGIVMDLTARRSSVQTATRMQREAIWDVLEFGLNGAVFVLLGLHLPAIVHAVPQIAFAFARGNVWLLLFHVVAVVFVLFALRFLWVWISLVLTMRRASGEGVALRDVSVMTLAGARGVLTLAAALSVPLTLPDGTAFPARDLFIFLAAGVILVTLLLGSVGLAPLLRRAALRNEDAAILQERRTRIVMAEAGLREMQRVHVAVLERASPERAAYAEAVAEILAEYAAQIAVSGQSEETRSKLRLLQMVDRELRLSGLRAQREALYRSSAENQIDQDGFRKLLHEIDLAETAIAGAKGHR